MITVKKGEVDVEGLEDEILAEFGVLIYSFLDHGFDENLIRRVVDVTIDKYSVDNFKIVREEE